MTPERWQRLQEIVEAALARPPEARQDWVARACGDDSRLREEALRLLANAEHEDDALAAVVGRAAADTVGGADLLIGQRIGAFEIRREIGRGGMGAVYLADRADGAYDQRVAIKILSGLVGQEAERRLRRERQILARLTHPNIARLLDGGTTAAGQAYLVMEYIEGQPLNRYCDDQRLSIGERLDLLGRILSAVHYAHRHLVVHRDLKPGNILVTADGEPKLLDFGIAALVETDEVASTESLTVLHAMTPEYASPEQICGEMVTTATDVYSLGVLMYELLTGHQCLQFDSLRPAHVESVAVSQIPVNPSSVVRQALHYRRPGDDDTAVLPETVAKRRSETPAGLSRRLRGDLDAICQQALRKEPERRYASAEAMLEDLNAHRRGEPVDARGMNWRYRTGKFMARHRLGVGLAGAAVLLLAGVAVVMTAMSWKLAEQRDRALAAESTAREEQATAERVVDFLISIFDHSDPNNARGQTLNARELLDRGAERMERELADEPVIHARLQDAMARVYRHLGAFEQAEALARSALAIREQVFEPNSLEVAETLTTLGETLRRAGHFHETVPIYQRVLAIRTELESTPSDPIAEIENNLGVLLTQLGDYDEAETLLESAYAQRHSLFGESHELTALTLHNIGYLHYSAGNTDRAERVLSKTLTLRQAALEADHPGIYRTMGLLAQVRGRQGRYADAEQMQRQVLAHKRRVFESPHPALMRALNDLAATLHDQNKLADAEPFYREAIAMSAELSSEPSVDDASIVNNFAALLDDLGRKEEAERHYLQSLAIRRAIFGDEHPRVAHAMDNLGDFLTRQHRLEEARSLLDDALKLRREAFGDVHFTVAETLVNRAILANAEDDHATAESMAREGLAAYAQTLGEDHWRHAWARTVLGAALVGQDRFEASEDLLHSGYAVIRETKGADAPDARRAHERLANWYRHQNMAVPEAAAAFANEDTALP